MPKPPARFEEFRRRAETLIEQPSRVQNLLGQASRKMSKAGGGRLAEMRQQLAVAMALVRAWVAGDYRQVSNKTLVILLTALLYFVMPLDVIPDFLFAFD